MGDRSAKPATVTLGGLAGGDWQNVSLGRYASLSEVARAGLRALDREEDALDAMLRSRVAAALADPGVSIDQLNAFADLRDRH